jgi:serine/threonine protein kinase
LEPFNLAMEHFNHARVDLSFLETNELGEGTAARVYKVIINGEESALKVSSANEETYEGRDNIHELEMLKEMEVLHDEGIPVIYCKSNFEHSDYQFVSTPYHQGGVELSKISSDMTSTLDGRILLGAEVGFPYTPCHIIMEIIKAISDINKKGFIHGDIDLGNILVIPGPEEAPEKSTILIIDVGHMQKICDYNRLVDFGSYEFIAPEVTNKIPRNHASTVLGEANKTRYYHGIDAFALGVTLYRLFTGSTFGDLTRDEESMLKPTGVDGITYDDTSLLHLRLFARHLRRGNREFLLDTPLANPNITEIISELTCLNINVYSPDGEDTRGLEYLRSTVPEIYEQYLSRDGPGESELPS